MTRRQAGRDVDARGYWLKNLRKVERFGYDLDRVLMVDDESHSFGKTTAATSPRNLTAICLNVLLMKTRMVRQGFMARIGGFPAWENPNPPSCFSLTRIEPASL